MVRKDRIGQEQEGPISKQIKNLRQVEPEYLRHLEWLQMHQHLELRILHVVLCLQEQ
jgi:hypothetical protein